jgi:hypothetical protein
MNAESPLLRFAEFYLSPIMSRKSLDLLKLKLVKPALKNEDPGLVELRALRELSLTMGKKRKSLLSDEERQSTLSPEERELYSLDPEEALLLATQPPFLIPLKSLSLAFGSPEESLRFRVRSLLNRLEDTGTLLSSWNTSLPSREIQPPSVRRRGSWIESFRGLPVGLRFTIETSFILSGLMILLWLIPEIRNRYETSIQRRINDYLIESSLLDAPAPEGTSKTPRTPIETPTEAGASESDMPVNRSSSEEPSARKQPKVNEGETWRFSFTGSATNEIESGVLEILKSYPSDQIKPLTVPGGIQFDFMLGVGQLIPLKTRLESLVYDLQSRTSPDRQGGGNSVNMSWYKKRNMGTRKIPDAHVQVIVWISTL